MNQPDFIAHSAAELAAVGNALLNPKDQNTLDEQLQMTRLLEALATTNLMEFPLSIKHTGPKAVPDFQLQAGQRRIGLEITKIAVAAVEHARALQRKGLARSIGISSLYREQPNRRTRREVLDEALLMSPFADPVSIEEYEQIWLERAREALTEKTRSIYGTEFQRGDEDWLLLWDRLGTTDWQLNVRLQALRELLNQHWRRNWYSRVFLQAENFSWQAAFTPSGFSML
jgi:hypothetical protein